MKTPTIQHQLQSSIKQVIHLYHQLILLVGPISSGKSRIILNAANEEGSTPINVSLELTKEMLDLTEKKRILKVSSILDTIIRERFNNVIFLDNIEVLFDVSLKQDPLRLLQGLSRNRIIVAAWNGLIEKNYLTYAEPGHQEYRRYPLDGLQIIDVTQGKTKIQ